jgi:PAS domain S-box-containing protein
MATKRPILGFHPSAFDTSMRVLIVDDHEFVRKGVRSLLSDNDTLVVCGEAVDGVEALAKSRDLRPDLILMDISMPRMDGIAATRAIRQEMPGCKVILVSQNDPAVVAQQAAEVGADAFVPKSDLANALLPTLLSVLTAADGKPTEALPGAAVLEYELRILEEIGTTLASDLDLKSVVQATTDAGRQLSGAGFGAFFYNVLNEKGESYMLYTLSGASPEDFANFPMPRNTCVFAPTFAGEGTLRLADVTKDHRYGKNAPYHGMPRGHLPVRSYLAVPVVSRSGEVLGGLFYGHPQAGIFSERAERLLQGIARHAAIAIDNARLYEQAKQAEAEAQVVAERLRLAQQAAQIGSFEWNIKTGRNSWTPELEAMYGLQAGTFPGTQEAWEQLIHPDDRAEAKARVQEAFETGAFEHEWRVIRSDGSVRWIFGRALLLRDSDAKPERLLGVNIDVTQKKQAEDVNNLLAAIVDSSDDAIVSKNLDGIITSWNSGAERIFGYEAAEAIGKNIRLTIPPDRLHEEDDILRRVRNGTRIDHFETVRQRKDGTLIDVSVTISPVRDSTGKIIGASKVARDIRHQKQAELLQKQSEERFRRLSESLETQVRARTSQLRELSWKLLRAQDEERRHLARELHDSAGQSLTALGMNLASILHRVQAKVPEVVALIERTKETLQELTREIRTTSYLLHPPLLDENGLPAALSWYVRGLSERSGLDVTLDVSEGFDRLPRDMELVVFRLVQECLTNVHRHSGSQSASIEIREDGAEVSVRVRDQGKGIPPERLAEIQAGTSGVGIRGMKERLSQFDGVLRIDSNGVGTAVVATIPRVTKP